MTRHCQQETECKEAGRGAAVMDGLSLINNMSKGRCVVVNDAACVPFSFRHDANRHFQNGGFTDAFIGRHQRQKAVAFLGKSGGNTGFFLWRSRHSDSVQRVVTPCPVSLTLFDTVAFLVYNTLYQTLYLL